MPRTRHLGLLKNGFEVKLRKRIFIKSYTGVQPLIVDRYSTVFVTVDYRQILSNSKIFEMR